MPFKMLPGSDINKGLHYFHNGVEVPIPWEHDAEDIAAQREAVEKAQRENQLAGDARRHKAYRERHKVVQESQQDTRTPRVMVSVRMTAETKARLEKEWQRTFRTHGLNKNDWYLNRIVNGGGK